jgi:hypothetical protein
VNNKKLIGFTITTEKVNPSIDIFNVGLKLFTITHNNFHIYLWGIGEIENCKINGKYSLSFPLNDSLLDRNILISFEGNEIIIENDWLGSIPVFYNPIEKIVSTISNFCLKDIKIHKEGLSNFCEFGYSVFEQTVFEDVKFMRYYSKLIVSNEFIKVEYKIDPVTEESFLEKESDENDVIDLMQDYVSRIESKMDGDILLPTSGGYDSRLLNFLVKDKSRIRSFTYGISKDQNKSSEVVHAKKISDIFSTKWEQIELKHFPKYISKWFSIYGFSTHLHGMYHIEFYNNILEKHKFNNPSFLSGIFGDIWAGNISYENISNHIDLIKLGYTHGLNMDLNDLMIITDNIIKKSYFNINKEFLAQDNLKPIFNIRLKMTLISYLTQIPEYFGFPVWTPFLNFNIVRATLNISDERRKNRIWQRDFFKKVGLYLEAMNLKSDKSNMLDYEIAQSNYFEPIDTEMMKTFIKVEKLIEINRLLSKITFFESIKNQLLVTPKIGGMLRRLGFKSNFLKVHYEYYIIKAIEMGLKHGN